MVRGVPCPSRNGGQYVPGPINVSECFCSPHMFTCAADVSRVLGSIYEYASTAAALSTSIILVVQETMMKASQGQRDLAQRPEGQCEGQGHDEMVRRLDTITESDEKQHVDEPLISNNTPPQYERYSNVFDDDNNSTRLPEVIRAPAPLMADSLVVATYRCLTVFARWRQCLCLSDT